MAGPQPHHVWPSEIFLQSHSHPDRLQAAEGPTAMPSDFINGIDSFRDDPGPGFTRLVAGRLSDRSRVAGL